MSSTITVGSVTNVSATIEGKSLYCFEIAVESTSTDFPDCNANGIPDRCDIANGMSEDVDDNGTPDECQSFFIRGEVNSDGEVDLSDAIAILSWLFLGHTEPPCLDAAAVNDSSEIDLSDAVAIFGFLFLGDVAPPKPGPVDCGPDPTIDELTCEAFEGCGDQ